MRYKANPVCVTANTITNVGESGNDKSRLVTLDDGRSVVATEGMLARMTPVPGDYWVVNEEDGYTYLNPKAVFERKYRPIEDLKTVSA